MSSVLQTILDLAERFARSGEQYRSPGHNETQARRVEWPLPGLKPDSSGAVY